MDKISGICNQKRLNQVLTLHKKYRIVPNYIKDNFILLIEND